MGLSQSISDKNTEQNPLPKFAAFAPLAGAASGRSIHNFQFAGQH
jgi:hypothetical protein